MLAVTSSALYLTGDVRLSRKMAVRTQLPDNVGEYKGEDILFCQNPQCALAVSGSDKPETDRCPECGGALAQWSFAEKKNLPEDTILLRKRYLDAHDRAFTVTVVISGKERTSIHRPEMCLTGQSRRITKRTRVNVPLGSDILPVMILDLETRLMPRGKIARRNFSSYAYWFAAPGHDETPSHWKRTWLTARDNILRGRHPRWAYIGIMTSRRPGNSGHIERLKDFIADLRPMITLP